ncbi:MAG: Acg family FMN-binding oxidoreductase, partial [Acidimicrobiales bacterium]
MAVADRHQSWMVDDADFPAAGDTEDLLRFALRYAVLAPSSHNSQPWLFRVDGKAVEVYADRSRRLPVVDPDDRELVMSCGAALYNLRLALSHVGEGVDVSILPNGTDGDLLARVELSGRPVPPNAPTEDLFTAITNRHTCRRAFDQTPVEQKIVQDLRNAAFAEGAWLFDVPDEQRNTVTWLVTDADFIQMSEPAFRRELAHWMRTSHPVRDDGMPGYALGLSELQSVVGPLMVRTFDIGTSQAAKDEELSRWSALLAVIVTSSDDTPDWVAAGQALQRVLLTATAAGLQTSFLNQPIEISSMRVQLGRELGLPGHPQLLLRFGYGPNA